MYIYFLRLGRYRKERAVQLGFYPQKEVVYNRLLPYSADIDAESTAWFRDIKANLGRALAVRELRPGLVVWISRLNKYLRLYGLKFPLADHIALIKLLLNRRREFGMLRSGFYRFGGCRSALLGNWPR